MSSGNDIERESEPHLPEEPDRDNRSRRDRELRKEVDELVHQYLDMAAEKFPKYELTPLTPGASFKIWQKRAIQTFRNHEVWQIVEGTELEPEGAGRKVWEKKHNQALDALMRALPDSVVDEVCNEELICDQWKKLVKKFTDKMVSDKIFLKKEYNSKEMAEGADPVEHLETMSELKRGRIAAGDDVSEEDHIERLIDSLPKSWDVQKKSMRRQRGLTLAECESAIKEEARTLKRENAIVASNDAAMAMARSVVADEIAKFVRSGRGGQRGGRGRGRGGGQGRGGGGPQRNGFVSNSPSTCNFCKKEGHFVRDCPEAAERDRQRAARGEPPYVPKNQRGRRAAEADQVVEEEFSFQAVSGKRAQIDGWCIDSGATAHMTASRTLLNNYTTLQRPIRIVLADNSSRQAVGKGTAKMRVGKEVVELIEVLYVPGLGDNLCSVPKLLKSKIGVNFTTNESDETEWLVLTSRGRELGRVSMSADEFRFALAQQAKSEDEDKLQHYRLGHLGATNTELLVHNAIGVHKPMSRIDNNACNVCIKAKSIAQVRDGEMKKATRLLERLHVDICGPFLVPERRGGKYFITLVDEWSRFFGIMIIINRQAIAEVVKSYITQVEVQKERKVAVIRSDNAKELISHELQVFCTEKGIGRETTPAYAPWLNGIVERGNRTILERVRALLLHAELPPEFWGDAALHATYLMNRAPHAALGGKTPFEKWTGELPKLASLVTFGAEVASLVPVEVREKIDKKLYPKTVDAIFLRHWSVGYWIYVPHEDKVRLVSTIIKRDETPGCGRRLLERCASEGRRLEMALIDKREKNRADKRAEGEREEKEEERGLAVGSEWMPRHFKEAWANPEWREAINSELDSHNQNNTWIEAKLPKGKQLVSTKWVFTVKGDGRKKARLVARGFSQIQGIDYSFTFSPTLRIESLRILLSAASARNMSVYVADIKTAYLHGIVEEEIYLGAPEGVETNTGVVKLRKALYGLKQAGREWHVRLRKYLFVLGFVNLVSDSCVFVNSDFSLLIGVYVDDLVVCGSTDAISISFLNSVNVEFPLSARGLIKEVLGVEIQKRGGKYLLRSTKQIKELLEKEINEVKGSYLTEKETTEYRSVVGMLRYITQISRPDLAYIVGVLSRSMQKPTGEDIRRAKKVVSYVSKTKNLALVLGGEALQAFADASFGSEGETKSVTGYCIYMGSGVVSWRSKLQRLIAMSSTEAEFQALTSATEEVSWIRGFLEELGYKISTSTKISVDNTAVIQLARDPVFHDRTKHFKRRMGFVQQCVDLGIINLQYVRSEDNVADLLTKPLSSTLREQHSSSLGLVELD